MDVDDDTKSAASSSDVEDDAPKSTPPSSVSPKPAPAAVKKVVAKAPLKPTTKPGKVAPAKVSLAPKKGKPLLLAKAKGADVKDKVAPKIKAAPAKKTPVKPSASKGAHVAKKKTPADNSDSELTAVEDDVNMASSSAGEEDAGAMSSDECEATEAFCGAS